MTNTQNTNRTRYDALRPALKKEHPEFAVEIIQQWQEYGYEVEINWVIKKGWEISLDGEPEGFILKDKITGVYLPDFDGALDGDDELIDLALWMMSIPLKPALASAQTEDDSPPEDGGELTAERVEVPDRYEYPKVQVKEAREVLIDDILSTGQVVIDIECTEKTVVLHLEDATNDIIRQRCRLTTKIAVIGYITENDVTPPEDGGVSPKPAADTTVEATRKFASELTVGDRVYADSPDNAPQVIAAITAPSTDIPIWAYADYEVTFQDGSAATYRDVQRVLIASFDEGDTPPDDNQSANSESTIDLTDKERAVLNSLYYNHYGYKGDWLWDDCHNRSYKPHNLPAATVPDVINSLVAKGFAHSQSFVVGLTPAGQALVEKMENGALRRHR